VTEPRKQFLDILERFDTAMLITRGGEGRLRARPMVVAEARPDGDLLFVTALDSAKVDELGTDPHAAAVFQARNHYLAVSGEAEVRRQHEEIDRLWKDEWKVWFERRDMPDLVVLHLHADEAEYWDLSRLTGFQLMLRAAREMARRRPIAGTQLEHARIPL
jgi:general stress protein 26